MAGNKFVVLEGFEYGDVELLYLMRCIPSINLCRDVRTKYATVRETTRQHILSAFPNNKSLVEFIGSIQAEQAALTDLLYDIPFYSVKGVGHDDTLAEDVKILRRERVLRADRNTDIKGRPVYVSSKSVWNLCRLIDAGPMPRLFW